MVTFATETKPEKLDIETRLTPEELRARLCLAVFSLLDEYPEHVSGTVRRALEIDIDPSNTADAHKKMLRVAQLIEELVGELENELSTDVVKKIKYTPREPSNNNLNT